MPEFDLIEKEEVGSFERKINPKVVSLKNKGFMRICGYFPRGSKVYLRSAPRKDKFKGDF